MPSGYNWDKCLLSLYKPLAGGNGLVGSLSEIQQDLAPTACAILHCNAAGRATDIIAAFGYDEQLRKRLGPVIAGNLHFLASEKWFLNSDRMWLDYELDCACHWQDSDYCRRWLTPQDFDRIAFGVILDEQEQGFTIIEVPWRKTDGIDETQVANEFSRLLPHLRQAFRIQRLLHEDVADCAPETPKITRMLDVSAMPADMRLRVLYKLTPKEIETAFLVAAGLTPKAIIEKLAQQKPSTVRSHLRHLREKTETSGQCELMHLLLTGPAELGREDLSDLACAIPA